MGYVVQFRIVWRKPMASCEKCWSDAYSYYYGHTDPERYHELLKERKDNPCSPKEQAGQWWDEEKQCDTRIKADG